jgi:hypothetical protein
MLMCRCVKLSIFWLKKVQETKKQRNKEEIWFFLSFAFSKLQKKTHVASSFRVRIAVLVVIWGHFFFLQKIFGFANTKRTIIFLMCKCVKVGLSGLTSSTPSNKRLYSKVTLIHCLISFACHEKYDCRKSTFKT